MYRRVARLLGVLVAVFFLFGASFLAVQAEELPIDIEIMRQQQAPGGAISDHFDVDIFNARAERIAQAVAEAKLSRETQLKNSLFLSSVAYESVDVDVQLTAMVMEADLFAEPSAFSIEDESGGNILTDALPGWLVVVVLAICAAAGLALHFGMRARKRRREEDVH